MPDIMIIDDDAHISEMLSESLKNEGYTVSAAYSGTEALLLLSGSKPDIILLDEPTNHLDITVTKNKRYTCYCSKCQS